jgi:hypothetical protein
LAVLSNTPLALTHDTKPSLFTWLYAFVKEWSNVKAARRLTARASQDLTFMRDMVAGCQKANVSLGKENEQLRNQIEQLEGYLKNFQQIDPNAKCPACGHTDGFIRAIVGKDDTGTERLVMQHNCKPCGFQFVEAPVIEDAVKVHQPDLPLQPGPSPIPLRPPH